MSAASSASPRIEALLAEVLEALADGRVEKALASAHDMVREAPSLGRSHHVLGLALMRSGGHEQALEAYGRALELDPGSPETLHDQGVAFMLLDRLKEAAVSFGRALEADPGFSEARRNLGLALAAMDKPKQALPHLRQALNELPGDAETLFGLGNTLMALDDPEAADDWFSRALSADPNHAMAMNGLASALMAQGEWDLARGWLEQAVALEPRFVQARINLGTLLLSQGDVAGAEQAYQAAVDAAPGMAGAWAHLGLVLEEQGRLEEALESFRRGRELDPSEPDTLHGLAGFLNRQGRHGEALDVLREAMGAHGGYPGLWFHMGQAMQGLEREGAGDGEEDHGAQARKAYEKCLERDPDDVWGAGLKLASMGVRQPPACVPEEHVKHVYAQRASMWEAARNGGEGEGRGYRGPELVRELVEYVLPDSRGLAVLDAGCGTGLCGPFLRPKASRLEGVDLSPDMIRLARAKGVYDRLETGELLAFLRANPETYDLIACAGVLFYFRDPEIVFKALAGALRPRGVTAFTLFTHTDRPTCMTGAGYFSHQMEEVETAVDKAGLTWARRVTDVHEYQDGEPVPCLAAALIKA